MFWKLNLQMCVKTGKMCVKLFACAKGFALSPQFFSMKTLRNCVLKGHTMSCFTKSNAWNQNFRLKWEQAKSISASKVFSHSYRLSPSDQASHTIFDEQKHFLERERGDTYLSFYISLSTQMFSIISKKISFKGKKLGAQLSIRCGIRWPKLSYLHKNLQSLII